MGRSLTVDEAYSVALKLTRRHDLVREGSALAADDAVKEQLANLIMWAEDLKRIVVENLADMEDERMTVTRQDRDVTAETIIDFWRLLDEIDELLRPALPLRLQD